MSGETTQNSSIDQLFHGALEYQGSKQYIKFFSFIARFTHYSRYNSMLVYLQDPSVTFFGTRWYWKEKFNRTIGKDAKPLLILAPHGPVILAYDIFDTLGDKPAKEFLEEGLGQNPFEVKGVFCECYLSDLKDFCGAFGIKVIEKPLSFFNTGAVTTRFSGSLEIHLRKGIPHADQFGTLCHELGHLLLGHTGHVLLKSNKGKSTIRLAKRSLGEKLQELEAETVSYLVCAKLGLVTKSLEYLATQVKDESDWSSFSYETVVKVSDRISGLIECTPPPKIKAFGDEL